MLINSNQISYCSLDYCLQYGEQMIISVKTNVIFQNKKFSPHASNVANL